MRTRLLRFVHSIGSVSLIMLVLFICSCTTSSPGGVAQTFFRAAADGDASLAIKMAPITLNGERQSDVKRIVDGFRHSVDSAGGLKSVEIVDVEKVQNGGVNVHVMLHLGDGATHESTLYLDSKGGAWVLRTASYYALSW